jgi:hypothetical protein
MVLNLMTESKRGVYEMRDIFDTDSHITRVTQPTTLGGTSAIVANTACENLEIVSKDQIGFANGVVPLDENGKVPVRFLNDPTLVNGDTITEPDLTNMYQGRNYIFLISNYDYQRTYDTTSVLNPFILVTEANVDEEIITQYGTYVPGNVIYIPENLGVETLTINSRTFTFTVVPSFIHKPTIIHPVADEVLTYANSGSPTTVYFTATPFTCTGYPDTQITAYYEMSDNIYFLQNTEGSFDSITITLNDVLNGADFLYADGNNISYRNIYVRVRYEGAVLGLSEWSDTVQFSIFRNV